jgi:hypothetical protein
MTKEKEQKLPEGWELLRFPSTIEIRDSSGAMVHAEGMPYTPVSEWDLKYGAIRRALDPCLRNPSPGMHSQNGWQLHYAR